MFSFFFDKELGRDFWNYRLGQLVSLVGDSCSHIALAWWILEKTGSALEMSSVLAPALFVRVFLMPLLGPLGDRFSRRNLVVFADLWRLLFTLGLAGMVFFDFYHLPLLVSLFVLISAGSALFNAGAAGIVPQIVRKERLQKAMQQTQAINSLGNIAGGILGGVIVSFAGVLGAFLFDAASYLVAGVFTALIRADTRPKRDEVPAGNAVRRWAGELAGGFRVLYRIPVLFWICIIAMFMNLALSPLGVILPVLAKEARNMPAWYLGSLESSIGLGAVIGAFSLQLPKKALKSHVLLLVSIAMIGTQVSLSVPDSHRARIGSIMGFLCNGVSPLGIAGVGFLIGKMGLTYSLLLMGLAVVLLTPLMLLIPRFGPYIDADPVEAESFFQRHYPGALK